MPVIPSRARDLAIEACEHTVLNEDQPLFVRSFNSFRMTTRLNRWLLLRQAVKRAQSPD
jgi:hypothetical protein